MLNKLMTALAACLFAVAALLAYQSVDAVALASEIHRPSASEAVFMVLPYTADGLHGGGTGFLVDHPQFGKVIVTNRHVCEAAGRYVNYFLIKQGEQEYIAYLRAKSTRTDLCLIKPPLQLARTHNGLHLGRPAGPGDRLLVFGHPYLKPLVVSTGSFINRRLEPYDLKHPEQSPLIRFDRMTVQVFPGNSGSPVLSMYGYVVGVVFAYEVRTHVGLMIPVDDLKRFIEEEATGGFL